MAKKMPSKRPTNFTKYSKGGREGGGGSSLNGNFSKIFIFFCDTSQKYKYRIFQPYWPKNIQYPKTWPTSTNAQLDLNLLTPAGISDIIGECSPPSESD